MMQDMTMSAGLLLNRRKSRSTSAQMRCMLSSHRKRAVRRRRCLELIAELAAREVEKDVVERDARDTQRLHRDAVGVGCFQHAARGLWRMMCRNAEDVTLGDHVIHSRH